MPEVFGLYDEQHAALGRIVGGTRKKKRGRQGAVEKLQTYSPPVRCIAMTAREYNPLEPEALPIFGYFQNRTVYNVVQVGSALAGYLALIINGKRWLVECRRENLDDVASYYGGLRITVLPGLWELDFGELSDAQAGLVSVDVERITDDENTSLCALFDDEDSVIYTGATIVRLEAWCTIYDPNQTPKAVRREITDCLPYQTGTVKAGAIGLGIWSWDAGYLVNAWECRTFSHAAGYVQAADPATVPVQDPSPPDPQPNPDPNPTPDPETGLP